MLTATLPVAVLLLVALVALLAPSGAVVTSKAGSPAPIHVAPAAATSTLPARTWGVTLPSLPNDTSGLSTLARQTGSSPGVAMWYVAWAQNTGFPVADAQRIRATGAVPEITWEPWDPAAGSTQPQYSLASIASGAHDAYLVSWARSIAAWGKPLRLRFAQEMNGTWYPWSDGHNGNAVGSFVKAWRHVVAVFRAQHAGNVTWVWSPNVPFTGSTPLSTVFPGDAYLDEVALDGYNWAGLQPGSTWTSFADVFRTGLAQLAALSKRPASIGEVGCPQDGGDKAAWTTAMWQTLASWIQVRSVMFFSFDKEADWRIDSSVAARAAFAHGVGAYLQQ